MKRILPYIIFVVLLLATSVAFCQSIVVWGVSHHLDTPPEGRSWVSVNPGIGIRASIGTYGRLETYFEADVIARNSTGGAMAMAGGGVQYPLLSRDEFTLLVGGAAGAVLYRNSWTKETHVFPGGYPYIGIRKSDVTVSVGYLPRIGKNPVQVYETLFANVVVELK